MEHQNDTPDKPSLRHREKDSDTKPRRPRSGAGAASAFDSMRMLEREYEWLNTDGKDELSKGHSSPAA
jgi:hypothetical protein